MEIGFNFWVIISCSILLLSCIYLEIKRKNKHWLIGRILGNILLCSSLALLVIPIFYQQKEVQAKNALTVLTAGANMDSLLKIKGRKYYTDPNLHQILKGKATFLADLSYYLAENPAINSLQVYGYGLTATDLKKLNHLPLYFYPAAEPSGIIACHWNNVLTQGDLLTVTGSYQNLSSEPILLQLRGFGTSLDSVRIAANAREAFSLKYQVRQNGKAVLQLLGLAGKDTVANEFLAMQSSPKKPIKTIMLTSFPSFEYKFLKNWLHEQSYPVGFSSRISKDHFSTDFLNRAKINLANLSAAQLQKEDVFMIDQYEFENLAAVSRQTLMQAVGKGLGLVIWLDEPNVNGSLQKNIRQLENLKDDKTLRLSVVDQQKGLADLNTQLKWYLSTNKEQQALIYNQNGQTIALQALYGAGKIVHTTLANSYQWVLNGYQDDYATYWTTLINAAARKQNEAIILNLAHAFPRINEKLPVHLSTQDTVAPTVTYKNQRLTINQNLLFPNQWEVQTWPIQSGWQTLDINQVAKDFYVYEKQAWMGIQQTQTIQNNLAYSRKTNAGAVESLTNEINYRKEISKWWFLIVLVLSASFLWFEKRHYAKD